ncbi:MAG: hypothetical protein IBX58_02120 [Roseovarius sp.]|nr:hypothetical protein [Roseovarius sp.]
MKRLRFFLPLLLGACALTAPAPTALLGPDPVMARGVYNTGGGITVAVDLREHDGRVMVCGVWSESDDQSGLTHGGPKMEVLGASSIYLDGKVLARGLLFLRKVPGAERYAGALAGCEITSRPWQARHATARPEISFPSVQIYLDATDVGADMVEFGPEITPR